MARLRAWAGRSLVNWLALSTAALVLLLVLLFAGLVLALSTRLAARDAGARLELVGSLFFGALLVLAVGLVLARRLGGRLTRPLRALSDAARAIAASGSPEALVAVEGEDETAQLAGAFNHMLERLRQARSAVEADLRSETRQAEEQLRLAQGALDQAADAITILDASGRVAWANEAACRVAGRPRQELQGRLAGELEPGPAETPWQTAWRDALATGRPTVVRTTTGEGGARRWFETSLNRLRHGGSDWTVAVERDVTARRQAEEALRLAGVGTLAAGAAHEINNPLSCIIGNLSYVRTELARLAQALPPYLVEPLLEVRQATQEALQGGERVRDVVRGLQAFSRPDELRLEATDLVQAVRTAVGMARHELSHVAHLIERYGEAGPVLATPRRLEQVFLNILVNAAQAVAEGPSAAPTVVVEVRAAGDEVVTEVRDTGPGMTPEVQAHVFEPFFTTRPTATGGGLGLATCHAIVASLGGRIEVESAPGQGSTFRIVLPIMGRDEAAPSRAAAAPAPAPDRIAGAPLGGELRAPQPAGVAAAVPKVDRQVQLPAWARILAVDDDPLIASMLQRTLAGGPEVVALQDGREALRRLLAGEHFDLFICDLMMPGLSGMEVQAALAGQLPEVAERMIFITGGAFTARTQAFLAGCHNDRVEKPFDPFALRRLVADRLGQLAPGAAPPGETKRALAPEGHGP